MKYLQLCWLIISTKESYRSFLVKSLILTTIFLSRTYDTLLKHLNPISLQQLVVGKVAIFFFVVNFLILREKDMVIRSSIKRYVKR